MTPEQIRRRFVARIRKYLNSIRAEIKSQGGYTTPVDDESDEEYKFAFGAFPTRAKETSKSVDVSLTICEESAREGSGEGYAFILDAVTWEGHMLVSLCPANYTAGLWLTRPEDLESRWSDIESIRPAHIAAEIMKWMEESC